MGVNSYRRAELLVNCLGGLSLPRKSVVRLNDCPDMAIAVYRGCKTITQQQFLLNNTLCRRKFFPLDYFCDKILLCRRETGTKVLLCKNCEKALNFKLIVFRTFRECQVYGVTIFLEHEINFKYSWQHSLVLVMHQPSCANEGRRMNRNYLSIVVLASLSPELMATTFSC